MHAKFPSGAIIRGVMALDTPSLVAQHLPIHLVMALRRGFGGCTIRWKPGNAMPTQNNLHVPDELPAELQAKTAEEGKSWTLWRLRLCTEGLRIAPGKSCWNTGVKENALRAIRRQTSRSS
jgi:hypothetical protein